MSKASDIISTQQQRCVDAVNQLIERCKLSVPRISSFQEFNSSLFVALYENITGYAVPDLLPGCDTFTEAHNVQAVIDTLSLELLGLSLSHISGEDIVSGDTVAISNLLEVLEAVSVNLFSQENSKLKDGGENACAEKSEITTSSESGIKKSSAVTSEGENTVPTIVLKRKTCKRTLRKSQRSYKVNGRSQPSSSSSSNSKIIHDHKSLYSERQPGKSPFSKLNSRDVKDSKSAPKETSKAHRKTKCNDIESVEKLYDSNFEKKLRVLLMSSKSPRLRSLQMKRNYLQNLRTPLKRTEIPVCKKSFLLPYNLRHKSVHSSHSKVKKRKVVQMEECSSSESSEKQERGKSENETPLLIQSLLEEFPGFQFPKNTLHLLTKHYYQHLGHMHKQMRDTFLKKPTALVQAMKVSKQQSMLSSIISKDIQEREYLWELNEQKASERKIKCSLRDARFKSVKMKQYLEEFQTSMRRKMQKRNYSEELIIENTFKEVLNLQKEKVRILCEKVKETDQHDARQHRKYLSALQHLYQEQLTLLAESLTTEQKATSDRTKVQKLAVQKMDQEFCKKLQKDIRSLQNDVLDMMKDIHFRELDAQNFIHQQRFGV